jgi:hypothetical protein
MDSSPMKEKLDKWLRILFLGAILSSVLGCGPYLGDTREVEHNLDTRFYSFNSTSILNSLKQGSSGVFTLLEKTPQPIAHIPRVTVLWIQVDYFRVAQAIQQSVWNEPLEALSLSDAIFTLDCSDIEQSVFSMAAFTFYKMVQNEGVETRIQYIIRIIPSENYVRTSRAEYYPNARVLEQTELGQYPITAEKALKIAEENGGAGIRFENNNLCMVDGIVNGLDGWSVLYQTKNEYSWNTVYEIAINQQTGSFKVTRPKK